MKIKKAKTIIFYSILLVVISMLLLSIISVLSYLINPEPIPWWVVPLIMFSIGAVPLMILIVTYVILLLVERKKQK